MDAQLSESFIARWRQYFSDAELPICCWYSDSVREEDLQESKNEHRCLIGDLNRVRDGCTYVYDAKTPGCPGGKRYAGYTDRVPPKFEFFLSCGIPGEMEGERYKKTPELVQQFVEKSPRFHAAGKYLVFKRWDKVREDEQPVLVIFFATADVLSGLFTLANFDLPDIHGVIAPMGAGCGSILAYPLTEAKSGNPRCVLGMFDVSARPYVPQDRLTFTVPMARFEQMVANMEESFLSTQSWDAVRKRLQV